MSVRGLNRTQNREGNRTPREARSSFVIHIPRPTIRPTMVGLAVRSFPASSLQRLRVPCLRVMTDKQCHVMMMTAVSVSRTEKRRERERGERARGPIGVAILPPPSNIYVSSGNGGQNVKCIMFRPGGRARGAQAVRGRDHGHARPHASCDEAERRASAAAMQITRECQSRLGRTFGLVANQFTSAPKDDKLCLRHSAIYKARCKMAKCGSK